MIDVIFFIIIAFVVSMFFFSYWFDWDRGGRFSNRDHLPLRLTYVKLRPFNSGFSEKVKEEYR